MMQIGYKYRWWARCNHVCKKFGLWELLNLLWLRNISQKWICLEWSMIEMYGSKLLLRESRSIAGGMVLA